MCAGSIDDEGRTWSHLPTFFWNNGRKRSLRRKRGGKPHHQRTSFCKAAPPKGGKEEGDIGLIEGCDRKAPIWGGGGHGSVVVGAAVVPTSGNLERRIRERETDPR